MKGEGCGVGRVGFFTCMFVVQSGRISTSSGLLSCQDTSLSLNEVALTAHHVP